jgi:hypothetical protein
MSAAYLKAIGELGMSTPFGPTVMA